MQHLQRERGAAADHERLQRLGNLLLANLTRIEPGSDSVAVEDYQDGAEVRVDLAPNLSPAENAAAYFERAKRARRRLQAVGRRLQQAQQELGRLQADAPTGGGPSAEPGPAAPAAAGSRRTVGAAGSHAPAAAAANPQRRRADAGQRPVHPAGGA